MDAERLLYFCVPNKKGYLQQLRLPFLHFKPDLLKQQTTREAAFEALKFRNSLTYLGKGCEELLLVCTPACDIGVYQPTEYSDLCFIKTSSKTDIECYLSGHRSSILFQGDKALRLKGCGNDFNGFEYIKGTGLRGCHFYHTSKRQLFMTDYINKQLKLRGKPIANTPVGFFEYQRNFTKQLPEGCLLKDDLPLLPKYCCVFETKGERRAGTHLISPLQVILASLVKIDWEQLTKAFGDINRLEGTTVSDTPTEWDFKELTLERTFLEEYELKHKEGRQPLVHLDFLKVKLPTEKLDEKTLQEKVSELLKTYNIQPGYEQMLSSKLHKLIETGRLLELIVVLAAKVGSEVGHFKRMMCQQGINWGYFNDHKVDHCNAHLNNFVVLQPAKDENVLAPLDFDLAFSKQEFIQIDRESPLYGTNDPLNFEELLQGEFTALQLSISGMELMNFKYGIMKEEEAEHYRLLKCVLRDTLVRNYIDGFLGRSLPEHILSAYYSSIAQLRDLVACSLIISMDFET